MDWTVTTYVGYLAVAVPLTMWVAHVLSTNGTIFLADVFEGRHELAGAVNRLLVVGFYLLNVGFVLLFLRLGEPVTGPSGMLESLSVKLGVVLLVLGGVHFLNVLAFNSIRRRHRFERSTMPPVPPQRVVPGAFAPYPGPHPAPGH
ncbi:MAG TPA: hypothetical protein VGE77_03815 [Nocardioides sp.]